MKTKAPQFDLPGDQPFNLAGEMLKEPAAQQPQRIDTQTADMFEQKSQAVVLCKNCHAPARFVRSRPFSDDSGHVYECLTQGCKSHGLYFYGPKPPQQQPACGFQMAGMMPPCVLPDGHAGDHADGFGGHYGRTEGHTLKQNGKQLYYEPNDQQPQ